jgi:thioredoxin reductase
MPDPLHYDVVIVGGGPAGLSAALILGRCRRRVLIVDAGRPRNAAAHAMHGFLSRDGMPPQEFLEIARAQLEPYPVEVRVGEATDASATPAGFAVTLGDGSTVTCRKLLLATGLVDALPELPGVRDLYGRGVVHCPYCDGWEARDQPLVVYAPQDDGVELALHLLTWSDDVMLLTDGRAAVGAEQRQRLARHGVRLCEERVETLVADQGSLAGVALVSGETIACRTLFLKMSQDQGSTLAEKLGAITTASSGVVTDQVERTTIPGLYVAGDASRDVLLVIVAAAEGAKAAFAINCELQKEDLA